MNRAFYAGSRILYIEDISIIYHAALMGYEVLIKENFKIASPIKEEANICNRIIDVLCKKGMLKTWSYEREAVADYYISKDEYL